MTSLGVWKIPEPFSPARKNATLKNGSTIERIPVAKEGLAVTESDRSLKVQTDGPHLVSLGSDRLSTAITIHPVHEGRIFVGSEVVASAKGIVIQGIGIEKDHCFIENINGLVTIYPQSGAVSIDSIHITEPTRLSQGCMLCLGRSNLFRFNHPKEARLIKQILPSSSIPFVPTAFTPIQSASSVQKASNVNASSSSPFMESVDFVEKVSKFEYLAHSQAPSVTSQDVPKWFIKEGIRIPYQPVTRGLKGHPTLSEINLKTTSSFVRFLDPSTRTAKTGFSTPPPYPYHMCNSRINMSPKNTRLYSKTPDPVVMDRRSPGNLWSGRCTPTSPQLSACKSHHISLENLKACEHELQEQHRKAVQERLKDEEQERQERLRLEEILNLCAEYEHKAQQEKQVKETSKDNKVQASSSSSGEFSAASSESSAAESSNSSEKSTDCNSSKCDSNVESCLSDDSRCEKMNKHSPSTMQHMQSSNQTALPCGMKSCTSPTYVYSSGYHTVPNRIKTNGSLPRDRNSGNELSPTYDQSRFVSFPSDLNPADGSTLYVNHKALNSASSEDELCAILGNSTMIKSNLSEEPETNSPCMGTAFLNYPHSPRTRIRTVASSHDRVPEVYENKCALNEFLQMQDTKLSTSDTTNYSTVALKGIPRVPEGLNFVNSEVGGVNKVNFDLEEEFYELQKSKQDNIHAIEAIKQKVSELDSQKNESLNELELEHALISGELAGEEQQQELALNRIQELQNRELALGKKYELPRQEVEIAKDKVEEREKLVYDIQHTIKILEQDCTVDHNSVLEHKTQELRDQMELLDVERKAFEDLEFQQLEYQAHREEEKEAVEMEIGCLKERMDERQAKIKELTLQKQALASQVENEKINFECQLKSCSEQLQQNMINLEAVESRLKSLNSIHPCGTPNSSIENSPRTSDSDLEIRRKLPKNGEWKRPPLLEGHQPSERSDNCNSFHSFESESSSLTSSDPGDSGRKPDDPLKSVDGQSARDGNMVRQKDQAFQSSLQDERPLVNNYPNNGNYDVKRRDRQKAQRPLTRYLPVRNSEFDLRQHIETAGHQIELCPVIHLTSSSCHGYLHKLGGKWRTWKKRWFVFDRLQRALLYYSDKGQTKLKGGVYFQAIEEVYVDHLHSVKSPSPHSTFCVKTYDRVYYLMAPTPESMRIWVDVIFTGAEGYMDFLVEAE